ncbi:hypothetical protein BaRGS_00022342 [Batillaria attramentaria]|uniref:Nucleotide exchange factor Fes1 domain-containing protein n=1 Tax=Batillaria attramentaria TaxID=370345 RepID=A0ABD0KGU9_9CAEN
MADGGSGNDGDHPSRMPKDMKGLLKFCAENTKAEDAPGTSNFSEMSPERKEWLSKALDEMSVSPAERMQTCIKTVKEFVDSAEPEPSKEALDGAVNSLQELQEWCEQIDFAVDFHKMGGFPILPKVFAHSDSDIRWRGLELVAVLVQNNPYCQERILEAQLLPELLRILDTDSLVRDSEKAQEEFVKHDGFSVLMRAMQSDVAKLKIKASFLLRSMCADNSRHKDTLCQMGMVEQLLGDLVQEHKQEHEHVMAALLCLARNHPPTLSECCRPELNLHTILKQRIKDVAGKEEHQEEREYAEELLKLISEEKEDDAQR